MTRGLRNNNPGNIRKSVTKYLGETESKDPEFKAFESMGWGYRAMFVLLYTYQTKHGLNTIRQMISRYAPSNENNTEAYIKAVSDWSGISPDKEIDTRSKTPMVPIIAAMSRMENGKHAYLPDVNIGWDLFYHHKP